MRTSVCVTSRIKIIIFDYLKRVIYSHRGLQVYGIQIIEAKILKMLVPCHFGHVWIS